MTDLRTLKRIQSLFDINCGALTPQLILTAVAKLRKKRKNIEVH
jgi:hypothetical protein